MWPPSHSHDALKLLFFCQLFVSFALVICLQYRKSCCYFSPPLYIQWYPEQIPWEFKILLRRSEQLLMWTSTLNYNINICRAPGSPFLLPADAPIVHSSLNSAPLICPQIVFLVNCFAGYRFHHCCQSELSVDTGHTVIPIKDLAGQ